MHFNFSAYCRSIRNATLAFVGFASTIVTAQAGDTYKWTVQYLVDNSQVVYGQSQKSWPRRNRGLALSPDGKFLYAGYHHGGNGQGEVRKLMVGMTDDFARATVRVLPGPLGKAIATDDKGRVYIANEGDVLVYDENLSQLQFTLQTDLCEGLAVVRDGKDLALYTAERQGGLVNRWTLEEKSGVIVGASLSLGFGEKGTAVIRPAVSLRGMDVDSKGRVWVTDMEGGRIFRLSKDGKTVESADVARPMDVAFDGERAFVSCGTERVIAVFELEGLKLLGNLAAPWDELELSPYGNNRAGGLSGIATIPGKGFFVTNESGQTLDQKSTYGRADSATDLIAGKLYRDATNDDNEPILQALSIPDSK
jgi:DNA-binding beta-propeller fold protein YncE